MGKTPMQLEWARHIKGQVLILAPLGVTYQTQREGQKFGIDLTCEVSDAEGKALTTVKAQGNGTAEFAEFKSDFGLAGRRAAVQLSEQFKQQVQADAKLR